MKTEPFTFQINLPGGRPTYFEHHLERNLSAMKGQFLDDEAYRQMVDAGDPTLYEVYEISRPEVAGELIHGISILHPGKVGDEYFVLDGHHRTSFARSEGIAFIDANVWEIEQKPVPAKPQIIDVRAEMFSKRNVAEEIVVYSSFECCCA